MKSLRLMKNDGIVYGFINYCVSVATQVVRRGTRAPQIITLSTLNLRSNVHRCIVPVSHSLFYFISLTPSLRVKYFIT